MKPLSLVIAFGCACSTPASPPPAAPPPGAPSTSQTVGVNITLSGLRPAAEIAKDLASHGVHVDAILDQLGVINAHASRSSFAAIRAIPGVAELAEDHEMSVPPNEESK